MKHSIAQNLPAQTLSKPTNNNSEKNQYPELRDEMLEVVSGGNYDVTCTRALAAAGQCPNK